jgi:hypothetical protein
LFRAPPAVEPYSTLQSTTDRIKKRTGHLINVKIAIMGCIVNGPGEMADADFGYVGGGPGKINLCGQRVRGKRASGRGGRRAVGHIDKGAWKMEGPPVTSGTGPDAATESRPLLFRIFFFASFGFLLYQLLRIVSPFLEGILVAITLALVFYPVHARFLRWTRGRSNLAAGQRDHLFLMVIVPATFFLGLLGPAGRGHLPLGPGTSERRPAQPERRHRGPTSRPCKKSMDPVPNPFDGSGGQPPGNDSPRRRSVGRKVSSGRRRRQKHFPPFAFQTVIMIFTLYFIFETAFAWLRTGR